MTSQATSVFSQLLLSAADPIIMLGLAFVFMLPKILKETRKLITSYRQENTKRMFKTPNPSSSPQSENPPGTHDDPDAPHPKQ